MQGIEYYVVGFYLPTIALLLFGTSFVTAILGSLVFNLFGILGGSLQLRLTNRVGIRALAIIGFCIVIATLLVLGLFGAHLPPLLGAVFVALFIFGHSFAPGSQGLTLAALSFPTSMRGVGSGFTQACQRVGSVVGFVFFSPVVAAAGLYPTLLMLSIALIIGLISALASDPLGSYRT